MLKNYIKNLRHDYIMNPEGYWLAIGLTVLILAIGLTNGLLNTL